MKVEGLRLMAFLIVFGVTVIMAGYFLSQTRIPQRIDLLTPESAEFEISQNSDLLIYWVILFFTCVVGIVEMFSALRGSNSIQKFLLFLLYLGLLTGAVCSVTRVFDIMRENHEILTKVYLGENFKNFPQYITANQSFFDGDLFRSIAFEWGLTIGIVVGLNLIFCGLTGDLPFWETENEEILKKS